jgi:S-DNA-T family DNA segregation ATPase FtsK/SpoIIIE
MAKAMKSKQEGLSFGKKEPGRHPVWSLVFFVAAILSSVALWDYEFGQNPYLRAPVAGVNRVGTLGLYFSVYSLAVLGRAAWMLPAWALWMSGMLVLKQSGKLSLGRHLMWVGIMISLPVLLSLWQVHEAGMMAAAKGDNYYPYGHGGWIGQTMYVHLLYKYLGGLGTLVVFGALFIAAFCYVFLDNLGVVIHRASVWLYGKSKIALAAFLAWKRARDERRRALAQRLREQAAAQARLAPPPRVRETPPPPVQTEETEPAAPRPVVTAKKVKTSLVPPEKAEEQAPQSTSAESPEVAPGGGGAVDDGASKASPPASAGPAPLRIVQEEKVRKVAVAQPEKKGDYEFPPLSLLADPPPPPPSDDESTHQLVADQLVRTLAEFGVKVTMGEVHPGPVITRYDLYPAAGVRVEKIQNLDKNLALALRAMSVRILAPVPGKGCVGVEIPNKQPQSVFIRDILESEDWVKSKAEIPIALGKEVSGRPLVADLTKMPHMLIAGATGSGKTVCINSIVASLLYRMSPDDLRFVMVDPKIVEMQVYNALPHMLIPVVTDPKKVPGALKYLINEMERRYRLFASEGVRNIAGYNAKRTRDKDAEQKARELEASLSPEERAAAAQASEVQVPRELNFDEDPQAKLPYIVCIVDELADLMMVAPADVETGIARLAQLARAAGIHLIIATQRPSVNVITGIIKANLPSRIAFKVASKVDSRTILDYGGADQLIGRGDMLFMPPGIAELVRSQGAFVADEEINGVVQFVNEHNGEPEFDEQFQRSVEESLDDEEGGDMDDGDDGDGDALLSDALEVIRTSKRASTSMLQRRLRIGYNRAARIMEILEQKGYVGPENGSMPREILRDLDE